MILFYTHQLHSRISYVASVLFKDILGAEIEITNNKENFKQFKGVKISYTNEPISDELFYKSSSLLFETTISKNTTLPSDPFAKSFYLLSRYEEYLPFTKDRYGRFSAKESASYQNNILTKPTVNIFAQELKKQIEAKHPNFLFPNKKYLFTPTLDIDNAYAYRGKSIIRTIAGYLRSIAKGDIQDIIARFNVVTKKKLDPYDSYELQFKIHKKYNLNPIYFFLLANWGENDKNLPYAHPLMQSLIKNISSVAEIGIHPSYGSNKFPALISIEKKRLEDSLGKKITKSRQHFLKLTFPQTYRNLISSGIQDDYSMGYADEIGFRAGICSPFPFYDLEKEEITNLIIHPFPVMENTLNNYMKLSPEKALDKVKEVIKEIKNVNGEFISIWHNQTLNEQKEWKGWGEFYEKVIQEAL